MFSQLMEEQRERSRETQRIAFKDFIKDYGIGEDEIAKNEGIISKFEGYDKDEIESTIYGFGPTSVLIRETTFYQKQVDKLQILEQLKVRDSSSPFKIRSVMAQ